MVHRQHGPMIIQQSVICPDCRGQKEEPVAPEFICTDCKGSGKTPVQSRIEYLIKKGSDYGDFQIDNKGDFVRMDGNNEVRGHVVLQIRPPTDDKLRFNHLTRIHNYLVYEHTLTLQEALLGFNSLFFTHPDSTENPFVLKCQSRVIQPESMVEIPNKGMPVVNENGTVVDGLYGKLIILFHVKLPDTLTGITKHNLNNVMPPQSPSSQIPDDTTDPETIDIDGLTFTDRKSVEDRRSARGGRGGNPGFEGFQFEEGIPHGMPMPPNCAQQ